MVVPMLLAAFPMFLIVTFLIIIDGFIHVENKGPIFYLEPRNSAGKVFKVIKFRTVPLKEIEWIKEEPDNRSITGGTTEKTWAGKIILNWYLDELPQLINVLKGEMSLVGPRPHLLGQHRLELQEGLVYRDHLKAGILGVPQACKRSLEYSKSIEKMASCHKTRSKALRTPGRVLCQEMS